MELPLSKKASNREKIPTPIKIELALPPPPLPRNPKHAAYKEDFYGYGGFPVDGTEKMPGAHQIGAAISGPRIAGGNPKDPVILKILRSY